MKLTDKVRRGIDRDPRPVVEIARQAKISRAQLHRFIRRECELGSDKLDSLIETLGLRVRVDPPLKPEERYNPI